MPYANIEQQRACAKRSYQKHREARLLKNRKWSDANKEKHKTLVNSWVRGRYKKRKDYIDMVKNKPCLDCGNIFPPECMDFDHREHELKSFTVSGALTKNWDIILAEIDKCDVVCSNCHRIRTHKRKQYHAYRNK